MSHFGLATAALGSKYLFEVTKISVVNPFRWRYLIHAQGQLKIPPLVPGNQIPASSVYRAWICIRKIPISISKLKS